MIKNKYLLTIISFFLLLASLPTHAQLLTYDGQTYDYTLPPITLYINDVQITPQMPPIQLDQVTFVPLSDICETLGAAFEWKNEEKKIYIYHNDTLIILEINAQEVWINGETFPLQTPAKIINNKIMVPLRFISNQLNCEVEWLGGDQRQIHIQQILPVIPDLPEIHIPLEPLEPLEPSPTDDLPLWISSSLEYINNTNYDHPILTIDKNGLFTYDDLTITDAYGDRQIIIDLNADYEALFEEGIQEIQDAFLKKIEMITEDTTQIILHENRIQTYNVWEDENKIYIELLLPTEKYSKILFLDPGHGGVHPGSIQNNIIEKELNLKQALAVQNLLEQNTDIKVYMSREGDTNHFASVRDELLYRTQLANEIGAHYFISIHNNSGPSTASGTETFYYHSDSTSKEMASIVQQHIIEHCSTKDRKTKPSNDLLVLLSTNMPAILIEGGFISNEAEALTLQSDWFNNQFSEAVYKSIVEIFAF